MPHEKLTLYVAPGGNDRAPGTLAATSADGVNGPLATLAGARDVIRRYKRARGGLDRPVTVQVADGFYEMEETLRFDPRDSGTDACLVRYVAAPGAAPVISGGRRLTGWRETEHNGLRCWCVELPEVAAGRWNFTRLYVNGAPRSRPRAPKSGFHRFTGAARHAGGGSVSPDGPDQVSFAPGDIRRWHNWKDVEIVIYRLWIDIHHRLKKIDEKACLARFQAKNLGSLKDERGEFARYFADNVFEALDTPGEWYLDRPAGRLFYLPLPHEKPETTVVVAPRLTELVRVQGNGSRRVAHLSFENLAFAHQHWELPLECPGACQASVIVPGAMILEGAERCVFYGCSIAHVNGYGIEVLAGSTENTVAACALHDLGGGGIKIGHEKIKRANDASGGKRARQRAVPAIATTVVDCTIRDCGRLFPSAIGIWIGDSGWNRIVHNHIFNCHYTGISCGWTWGYAPTRTVANRIEHNHIHHINDRELLSDNGGIYTLGQQPGTTLRGNVIHDISCYGYGGWGIYPDEGSSEMRVEDNLVWGTKHAAYSTHYGRDNLVQNNIFALSRADHFGLGKREMHRSTLFRRNMVVSADGNVRSGWETAHYTACDNLLHTLDGSPFSIRGCRLAELQERGQFTNSVEADPLFTDAAGGDFSLRPDSPAIKLGFKPFDWRAAGPRFRAGRPQDYAGYARAFALPAADKPVVRTAIALRTPIAEVEAGGRAEFAVTLTNVGRAPGKGVVRFAAGPKGVAGRPSARRMAYALAPGEAMETRVAVRVPRGGTTFWLDSEPTGSDAVPARGLVLGRAAFRWAIPRMADVETPDAIGAALAGAPARRIADGDRAVAEVRLAAGDIGLLLHARLHETHFRPNLDEPWLGTAIELLAFPEAVPGAPNGKRHIKRQIFLAPRADGHRADGLRLDETTNRAVPAPEIRLRATPVAAGCDIAAIVPWSLLGFERPPAEIPFELIVDAVDPAGGGIVQCVMFDPPWDGWRRIPGHLVPGADGCTTRYCQKFDKD